jgi:hypothetical protein
VRNTFSSGLVCLINWVIDSPASDDLDADYREPMSVALGAQFDAGAFSFYASAEWFGSVGEYDVVETKPLQSQVPPQEFLLPITQPREAVLNLGGGVSIKATSCSSSPSAPASSPRRRILVTRLPRVRPTWQRLSVSE